MPQDIALFSVEQRGVIVEWCRQAPVLHFNCRRYDLNLIKEHFAELLANKTGKVQVGKKKKNEHHGAYEDKRLSFCRPYMGPGTSYEN